MAQTICVLSDGRYFPLSDRVSTSFYRERKVGYSKIMLNANDLHVMVA